MEKELPDSWVEIELGNILKLKNGYAFKSDDFKDTGIPVIRISNIQNELVQTENAARVDQSKIKQEFVVRRGDILIAMSGATTGKYGIYNEEVVALQNQRVGNLIPHDESLTSRKFILYLLGGLKKEIEEKAYGGAQPNISPKLIEEIRIGLPPLPEQQRIVAKLDTLFGHLDTLKTRLDRIPQLLKDFRQKVLTQAVTGKLTEEWREGKKLIGIELKKDKYDIEFEFLESYDFPETWHYIALGNFAECSRGKFTARPRNDPQFFDGVYPFMQIGDLPGNGGLFYSYSSTLNEKGKSVSKCFPKGTVVIAIVGATIGNTGILEKEVFFPDSLIGINSENAFSNFYIEYFLRFIKYKIRELSYAGGGQPNIKLPNIKNLGIAIPPVEEQQEIVRRVESLFAKADQIEASYQKLKAKIEQLPQALLAKAFRGELVAQLPNDGDARELLEQIKRAKEGLEKGGKGRKMKGEDELRMVAEDGARYGKK